MGQHAVTLLANARLRDDLARYAAAAELIVLPAVNPQHIAPGDFARASQLIAPALDAARAALGARAAGRAVGGNPVKAA